MNTLQNLITLRDKVFPVVFEMDKQGRVDLDNFASNCGTYHCLMGWYGEITGYNYICSQTKDERHFGIDEEDWPKLFGMSHCGSLTDRYNYLCNLITERETKLVPEKPLPDWNKLASGSCLVTS